MSSISDNTRGHIAGAAGAGVLGSGGWYAGSRIGNNKIVTSVAATAGVAVGARVEKVRPGFAGVGAGYLAESGKLGGFAQRTPSAVIHAARRAAQLTGDEQVEAVGRALDNTVGKMTGKVPAAVGASVDDAAVAPSRFGGILKRARAEAVSGVSATGFGEMSRKGTMHGTKFALAAIGAVGGYVLLKSAFDGS